jgi:hypothetical protein
VLPACWAAWAVRGGGGKVGQLGRRLGFGPLGWKLKKSFLFSKSFHNLQTNLNSIQIQISMTSTHKNKISENFTNQGKLCFGVKCNNQIFI